METIASAVWVKRDSLRAHWKRAQLLKPMGGVGRRGLEAWMVSAAVKASMRLWKCIFDEIGNRGGSVADTVRLQGGNIYHSNDCSLAALITQSTPRIISTC